MRLFYYDFDKDKVNIRKYSDFESALKYCDRNCIYLLKIYLKPQTNDISSDEEADIIPDEDAIPNHVPEHSIDKSNSRNNKVFSHGFDEYALRQEEEENANLMMENSKINDNYFDCSYSKSGKSYSVLKPASITLIDRLDPDAKPKSGVVKGWWSKATNSLGISTESREELSEYARVTKSIPILGNEDIILAIPGSVVKKTW
eukprot:CAMPEP_0197002300 /NCGR_PEP_ID=MMETSP1380-20130617/6826_1 /TAXON_ID=5936 /ORGANISM="Euplotes crassus, Strain CT5" /LENGTH=201 /DNA_ID=CAMNT_0042420367 /DNA_START=157 /DNA_END=759 /DNA_ORIENTATION=+